MTHESDETQGRNQRVTGTECRTSPLDLLRRCVVLCTESPGFVYGKEAQGARKVLSIKAHLDRGALAGSRH
jgi:hypothetical protein